VTGPRALVLLGLAGCGARRAPPEPAAPGPLGLDVGPLQWAEGALRVPLTRPAEPWAAHLDHLDWSATAADWTVEQVGVSLDLDAIPGAPTAWTLTLPAPAPPADRAVMVQGTVHITRRGGIRSAEVFRASTRLAADAPVVPTSVPETP
jgi:hypothetical protein